MSLEIITIGGIDILAQIFNAIAAITSNASFFNLMGAAETLGVAACVLRYVQRHDLKDLGKWLIFFVFINGILLTPKVDLLFTDKIYTTKVKKVDNVPVGIAAPFYIFSLGGNALAEMYDKFLSQPNDVRYTNTGMLFGQRLLDSSFNMTPKDSRFQGNMANFVESCVIPDVEINHKYTYRDIFESKDIAQFFFNPSFSPSQARTMFYTGANNSREYITCRDGTARLKTDLDNMLTVAKKNRKNSNASISKSKDGSYKVLGYSPNMYDIPEDMTSQIHLYLMGSSKSATDIYKQNILVNKLRRDFQFVPAAFDGTSDMVGNAAEQAQMKWRLANLASYQVTSKTLPALYTVFSALLVGIFPIIILAMFITELTGTIIKSYMGFLFSLMLYPVLFAIFNSIVNVLTHQTLAGEDFTISSADTIRSNLADIGATAGYLMISIPFISYGLIKGLGHAVSSAGSYLGNALSSATSGEASQVSTGNYNYGNMQMENVNGFKTDLNSSFRSGVSSMQLTNGATEIKNADGSLSYDAGTSLSKLPFSVNWSQSIQSSWSERTSMAINQEARNSQGVRESITNAISRLTGYNSGHTHSSMNGNDWADNDGLTKNTVVGNDNSVSNRDGSSQNKSFGDNSSEQTKVSGTVGWNALGNGFNGAHDSSTGLTSSNNNAISLGKQLENRFNSGESFAKLDGYIESVKGGITDTDFLTTLNNVQKDLRQAQERYNDYVETESKVLSQSKEAILSESRSDNVTHDLNSSLYRHIKANYSEEEQAKILSSAPTEEGMRLREQAINEVTSHHIDSIVNKYHSNAESLKGDYANTSIKNSTGSPVEDITVDPNQKIAPSSGETSGTVSGSNSGAANGSNSDSASSSNKKDRLQKEFDNAQELAKNKMKEVEKYNAVQRIAVDEKSKNVGVLAKGTESKLKKIIE